jgi:hypothetical protein
LVGNLLLHLQLLINFSQESINFSILQLFDDLLDHFEFGFELSRLHCESARQLLDFE